MATTMSCIACRCAVCRRMARPRRCSGQVQANEDLLGLRGLIGVYGRAPNPPAILSLICSTTAVYGSTASGSSWQGSQTMSVLETMLWQTSVRGASRWGWTRPCHAAEGGNVTILIDAESGALRQFDSGPYRLRYSDEAAALPPGLKK